MSSGTGRRVAPPLEHRILLTATLCLLAFGAVMVYSASSPLGVLNGQGNGTGDFFRYLIFEGGRLHLPVHIHTAIGIGDYFNLSQSNIMNLESVLRDPRYSGTTFVMIHGGYPLEREAIWLAAMKNVYLDSSFGELAQYPSAFKETLKMWLETFPDKITFGTDCFPYNQVLGAEESYWLGAESSRMALAAALAEMISEGEITEPRALELAHGYLHDNAVKLYGGRVH